MRIQTQSKTLDSLLHSVDRKILSVETEN